MAHITLSGVLLDPTGEFAVGDKVRFTHKSTTGETIMGAISVLNVPPNGAYSIDLEYGLVFVEYMDYRRGQWCNLGVATVNGTNPATSIPELLNALVPVSSAELIEFQAILADCVTAQTAAELAETAAELAETNAAQSAVDAENSAQSIDVDNLIQVFDTVTEYQASTDVYNVGKLIRLKDRGALFEIIAGTGTADGYGIIGNTNTTQSAVYNEDVISVKGYGAVGDGVTDDTLAIQAIFDDPSNLADTAFFFPNGVYLVTEIVIRDKQRIVVHGDGAVLMGAASTPLDCLLRLHNVSRSRFSGLKYYGEKDGDSNAGNYTCAIHITSNSTRADLPWLGASPSNQNWIMDGECVKFKAGIVSGNHLGESPQHREAQDSNYVSRFYFRSVMQPYYGNGLNTGIFFAETDFTPQQFSASSSWWDDNESFIARNDEGRAVFSACIFQKAVQGGWTFYGKDIKIAGGSQWESGAPNYITGDFSVSEAHRGYCVGLLEPMWQVAPGTEGTLTISGSEWRRINTDGTKDDTPVLFGTAEGSNKYKVNIKDSILSEWYFNPTVATSTTRQLFRGGDFRMTNVEIRNSSNFESFIFHGLGKTITNVDTTGNSMSTVADTADKGGWLVSGLQGGNFQKITSDIPSTSTAAFAIETVGFTGTIAGAGGTSGFRVESGFDYTLTAYFKRFTGTGNIFIGISWFDFGGTLLSNNTEWSATAGSMTLYGWDEWQRVYVPAKAPEGASYASIFITTSDSAIRAGFTDFDIS
jgi:hypothetical protein